MSRFRGEPCAAAGRRILLVEDDPGVRAALYAHFSRDNWQVTAASGVREAEFRLAQQEFELVVSDVRLPDGSGVELMRRAREASPAPVVLMTAFATVAEAVAAMHCGAGDYLIKPIAWSQLRDVAERLTKAAKHMPISHGEARRTSEVKTEAGQADEQPGAIMAAAASDPAPSALPFRELERMHLERTLALTQGNRTHAAEMLGISLRTVRNRIREYGLPPRRYA